MCRSGSDQRLALQTPPAAEVIGVRLAGEWSEQEGGWEQECLGLGVEAREASCLFGALPNRPQHLTRLSLTSTVPASGATAQLSS